MCLLEHESRVRLIFIKDSITQIKHLDKESVSTHQFISRQPGYSQILLVINHICNEEFPATCSNIQIIIREIHFIHMIRLRIRISVYNY